MAHEIRLPPLGEDVESGIVLDVLVSPGDHVEPEQPVLRLETEKATTEVPSPEAGTVRDVLVEVGQEVGSGAPILTLEGEGAAVPTEARPDEVVLDRRQQRERERAAEEARAREAPAERERSEREREAQRARAEETARAERAARERAREVEERRAREAPAPAREAPPREPARPAPPPAVRPGAAPRLHEPVPAPPSVRRLARELGVDVTDVVGTGPGGAVTEDDVKSHVRALVESLRREAPAPEAPELPDFARWGAVEREPLTGVRRATVRSMTRAWTHIPHVTQFDRADVTDLEAFRRRYGPEVAAAGGKLTMTAILVKVAAAALQRFPRFNASLDPDRAELILKRYVHIGVAVDTPQGLLVPVLRDADRKGLVTLAVELGRAAERARARRTSAEELQGASFSITNLGGLGTTAFTPIVQWPQVAILGVGRTRVEPVFQDGNFVPRHVLPLGITYDHRANDGADAARFLRWIAETLEAPLRLTMED